MIWVAAGPLEGLPHVQDALQTAIELEHAVVPPYLTAMYSLAAGSNDRIRSVLGGIVIEEMGHMALAANVLIATGGDPIFDDPAFIPGYPHALPFKLVDPNGKIVDLNLQRFSKELVETTFKSIEEPDDPIDYPNKPHPVWTDHGTYKSVGDFYADIKRALAAIGPGAITGDPRRQVTQFPNAVSPITNLEDALNAIDTIVQQGEGTHTMPTAPGGEIAHYYRFEGICRGKTLVPSGGSFSYSGLPLPFDRNAVLPLLTNPTSAHYEKHPEAMRLSGVFNTHYSTLLRSLQRAFNGEPDTIQNAVGLMYDCKIAALALMRTPLGDDMQHAAPTYEYIPS